MKPSSLDPDRGEPPRRLHVTTDGTLWLAVTVLLGFLGWYKSIDLILLLAYTMAGLAWLNGVLARRHAGRLHARRLPGAPVYAGEPVIHRVVCENRGLGQLSVTVEERTPAETIRWSVQGLAAGETRVCEARVVPTRRGQFEACLRVWSGYPFGLVRAGGTIRRPAEEAWVVLPQRGSINPRFVRTWLLRTAGGMGRTYRPLRRPSLDQDEIRGLRPYRLGDPPRLIHWRSSARRRQLLVREFDALPNPELILVVEPWLPNGADEAARAALEAALSLAVTLAHTWHTDCGGLVVVAVAGQPESVRVAGSGDAALRRALAPLATVAGGPRFAPLRPADFGRPLAQAIRVVVSSRAGGAYASELTTATGHPFLALAPGDQLPWFTPPCPSEPAARQAAGPAGIRR